MQNDRDLIRNARQLLQDMPDPICIIDHHGHILWKNETFRFRFGTVNQWNREGEVCRPHDHIIPIRNDDGQTVAFTVLVKDGPPQKIEEKIAEPLYERYKMIAENTSDTIVLVDNQKRVRYVSPSLKLLTGYSTEEYEGMDAFDIIHPDDRERVRFSHDQAIHTKTSIDIGYRICHAQGHVVHAEARVKPVLDSHGNVKYAVAVVRDVTERKKTEELLENILDNVNAAVWSTDKDFTGYKFCSESIEKISGIARKEIMSHPIRLHDHIHPEDNAVLMGEVKAKLDMGIPVSQEFRFIHVEGETRWGRLIVHPYVDHAGVIQRLDGIILDITEKKRSEMALEESEQRYKSLFENNLDGVFSIELNHFYFVNANRSFETITGIRLDHLADRCFLGLIYDEDHPAVYDTLFQVMQQGKPKDIECRLQTTGRERKS